MNEQIPNSGNSDASQAAFSRLQEFADTLADEQALHTEVAQTLQQETEEQAAARESRMQEMENWSNAMGTLTEAKAANERNNVQNLHEASKTDDADRANHLRTIVNMSRIAMMGQGRRDRSGVVVREDDGRNVTGRINADADNTITHTSANGSRTNKEYTYRSPARMSGTDAVPARKPTIRPVMR